MSGAASASLSQVANNNPDSTPTQGNNPNSNHSRQEDLLLDREHFGRIFYSQANMSDVVSVHQSNNNLEDNNSDSTPAPAQESIPSSTNPRQEDLLLNREHFGRIFYNQANMSDAAHLQENMEQDGNNNESDNVGQGPSTQEVNNNEGRSEKTRDQSKKDPSAGGQKRALLIGCADQVPENRKTLDSFLEELKIWMIEEEFIIVGDCKIINILMGKLKSCF